MPKSWSDPVKACNKHPRKVKGRWCGCRVGWRYRMGLPDPITGIAGKPVWSEVFPTKDAANADQRDKRDRIAEGSYVQDRGLTVAQYLSQWLDGRRRIGRRVSTLTNYQAVIENHLVPHLGAHRLGRLRPDHVQAMLDAIATSPSQRAGKAKTPVTAGTLLNIRAVLRASLNEAMRQQLVSRNVATLVTISTVRRAKPTALSSDRLKAFMFATRDESLEALFFFIAVYGVRRAEAAGLRWDAIDREQKLIRIGTAVLEVKGDHKCPHCGQVHRRLMFGIPKSAAGERIYPLVPSVAASLEHRAEKLQEERDLFGDDYADHGLVFARPDGNPWRPDWISSEFIRIMKASGAAAGLTKIPSLKALRSTMVTNLHEAGTPLEVISGVTGHSGGAVTRDYYLLVSAERTRDQFSTLATAMGSTWSGRSDHQSDHQATEALPDEEEES